MSPRFTRAEQIDRNRSRVLAAARRIFLVRGYHAATVDQIADEAGFSKGVVYSQFDSKADMFLELLEERIRERAAQNARLAEQMTDSGDRILLLEQAIREDRAAPGWRLLVTEFRVHAARDPELNRRYAVAHARTVEALAAVLSTISDRAGEEFRFPPRQLAEVVLAIETGAALEQAANPDALGGPRLAEVLGRLLGWLALTPASGAHQTPTDT